ncbi:MAG: efflux RND transporter periplasmic adaptor subunit [Gemmatimonadaceae bacterium]|nr:efflux RND transporter periplasmic adaptor subunit [Gemmatimonadaceae bacterium]
MVALTHFMARVPARAVSRVLAVAACTLLCSACGGGGSAPAAAAANVPADVRDTAFLSADAMTVSGVSVVNASRVAWRDVWQLPARLVLDPTTTQALGSIVEGRVTLVLVQPGDRVTRGQVLVTIHSHELTSARNDLGQATAGRTEAENAAHLAAAALARAERLYAAQAGSLADLERARATQVAALAGQRRAASEFDRATEMVHHLQPPGAMRAGIDPEDVLVRAPFDGVVVAREAQPGAVVVPGASLVTVSRTGSILLAMRVPEVALAAVRVGSEVQFTVPAFPGRAFNGRVTRVAPMLDSLSRTAEVFAVVANRSGELRGEMTAAAEVFGPGRDSVIAVPVSAIQDFEGDTVVVTSVKRGSGLLLEASRVRVGRRAAGLAEIISGLAPGVSVIHDGAAVAKAEILRQRDARASGGEPQ